MFFRKLDERRDGRPFCETVRVVRFFSILGVIAVPAALISVAYNDYKDSHTPWHGNPESVYRLSAQDWPTDIQNVYMELEDLREMYDLEAPDPLANWRKGDSVRWARHIEECKHYDKQFAAEHFVTEKPNKKDSVARREAEAMADPLCMWFPDPNAPATHASKCGAWHRRWYDEYGYPHYDYPPGPKFIRPSLFGQIEPDYFFDHDMWEYHVCASYDSDNRPGHVAVDGPDDDLANGYIEFCGLYVRREVLRRYSVFENQLDSFYVDLCRVEMKARKMRAEGIRYGDDPPYTPFEREVIHYIEYDSKRFFQPRCGLTTMLFDGWNNHTFAAAVLSFFAVLFGGYVGLLGIFLTKPPILDFGEGVAAIWKIALGEDPILDRINSDGDKKCASDEEPGSDEDDADDDNE